MTKKTAARTLRRRHNNAVLLASLRAAAHGRALILAAGGSDNIGAIASVERVLELLAFRLRYPHLERTSGIRTDPAAEISVEADADRRAGRPVMIEHVAPQRAFARAVCDRYAAGAPDDDIVAFIKAHYRLVLLSRGETTRLNAHNRSRMTPDRIAEAGIALVNSTLARVLSPAKTPAPAQSAPAPFGVEAEAKQTAAGFTRRS